MSSHTKGTDEALEIRRGYFRCHSLNAILLVEIAEDSAQVENYPADKTIASSLPPPGTKLRMYTIRTFLTLTITYQ